MKAAPKVSHLESHKGVIGSMTRAVLMATTPRGSFRAPKQPPKTLVQLGLPSVLETLIRVNQDLIRIIVGRNDVLELVRSMHRVYDSASCIQYLVLNANCSQLWRVPRTKSIEMC